MNLNEFNEELRKGCNEDLAETPDTLNLHLTQTEFMEKMRKEKNGQALLDLMESGEWRICERMNLCHGYRDNGTIYIDVPRWKNLVAHLQIVYNP